MGTLIRLKTSSLGDTIGASPYFEEYRKLAGEIVTVSCKFHEFFQPIYPSIKFIPFGFKNSSLFDKVLELDFMFDVPLQEGFAQQLGLDYQEIRPSIHLKNTSRPIEKKYVCVAVQSTVQSKYWNRKGGWESLVSLIKSSGLEVVCIDQYNSFGIEGNFNLSPRGAIDKTGMGLDETIRYLQHCEFAIGLSSGLMWLAHAVGKHTVMISGTTHEWCEYTIDVTRIINKSVCHGCFSEPDKTPFDASDWLWCPHNKGTKDQFICTTSITPEQVWEKIKNNNLL
jgi:autotransporter strand-loop-strand O-heptosyltransferase